MAGPEQLPSHPKSPLLFPEGQAAREGIFANAKCVGACLPAACPLPPRTCDLLGCLCGMCCASLIRAGLATANCHRASARGKQQPWDRELGLIFIF